jgi:hypothetical protein
VGVCQSERSEESTLRSPVLFGPIPEFLVSGENQTEPSIEPEARKLGTRLPHSVHSVHSVVKDSGVVFIGAVGA